MKKVIFMAILALFASIFTACASKSEALPSTEKGMAQMEFGAYVDNPQGGSNIFVSLGTHSFDVFRDRRELVREVYEICVNPPEKFKNFIQNSKQIEWRRRRLEISLFFRVKTAYGSRDFDERKILTCSFDKEDSALSSLNGEETPNKAEYVNLSEMIDTIINKKNFSQNFVYLIDAARSQHEANKINLNPPSKIATLKLGIKAVDPTNGREGLSFFKELNFDVNTDRRELVKLIYEICDKPNANMSAYIAQELNRSSMSFPTISVWYKDKNGKFVEFDQLKCTYHKSGGKSDLLSLGNTSKSNGLPYKSSNSTHRVDIINMLLGDGKSEKEKSQMDILGKSVADGISRESFSHSFTGLIDSANATQSD